MGATLKDVARRAGVSLATVSRVVNHVGGVSPAIVERVERALAELDYRPNEIARGLRAGSTHMVAAIVSDVTNPFFMEVIRGLEDGLRSQGYTVLIASTDEDLTKEEEYCRVLHRRQMDGIVLASSGQTYAGLSHLVGKTPVVLVDRLVEGAPYDAVLDDNRQGVDLLVDYLVARGHRHIGMVAGNQAFTSGQERLAAFREALGRHGLPAEPDWIPVGPFTVAFGREAARRLLALSRRPTAMVAANNRLALGLLTGLLEAGLQLPEEMTIVSYGDLSHADLFRVPITVVRQSGYAIGQEAATRILDRIRGDGRPPLIRRMQLELLDRMPPGPAGRVQP
ncbi:MAG: LacI family DNA-binding transcriptional regulator [Firmicutes bacterium]|nr:LacI family DNA-binding transcriptional regulator [Bacillota bacterium]